MIPSTIIAFSAPGVEGKGAAAHQQKRNGAGGPLWAAVLPREGAWWAARRAATAEAPTGRLTTPEEVAKLVASLASEAARQITGGAIPIDAGDTAG